MSEKNTKSVLTLKDVGVKSIITVLITALISIVLSLVLSFLLNMISTPELFYPYSGYMIISVSAFAAGKFYLKNLSGGHIPVLTLSAALITVIISLISVALNNGKTEIVPIIIKFILMFLIMSISALSSNKKKRKKNQIKRR